MNLASLKKLAASRTGTLAAVASLAGAATAVWVETRARRAEREHPPAGEIVEVDGVRLHYVERGDGPAVVLLHGNMVTLDDYAASGLVDRLARRHRVISIDRPGFGHSTRPRDRLWTPAAQAQAIHALLVRIGAVKPVVVGHSMGTLVALALALDFPQDVERLVLLGGYYYPTVRVDAALTAPVALPVLGDVMRYTVTALSSRAALGHAVKAMFAPCEVPDGFLGAVPRELMLRPVQLRANAEDAAFMMAAASALGRRYRELRIPVAIFAGSEDGVVDPQAHSERLHDELPGSALVLAAGSGHMVHHAVPEQIAATVESAAPAPVTGAAEDRGRS